MRGSLGSDGLRHIQGLASGGLNASIAGKLVFSHRERDGFGRNVITPADINTSGNFSASRLIGNPIGAAGSGDDLDDLKNYSLRGQLLFDINERASLLVGADYAKNQSNGSCRSIRNLDKAIAGLRLFWEIGIPQAAQNEDRHCATQFDTGQEREVHGVMGRLEYDLGWAMLTAISAWRSSEFSVLDDLTGIPLNDLDAPTPPGVPLPPGSFTARGNVINASQEDASQWSQELRLSHSTDRLNWVVGAFFMEEEVDREEEFYTQYSTLLQGLGLAGVGDVLFTQDNTTESTAIYGQIDYDITPQLTLTYGARWAEDKKDITQNSLDLLGTVPSGVPLILPPFAAPVSASDSWSEITQKVSLAWRPTQDIMLYATYSEGFKSGAFQSQTNLASVASEPVDPEIVENMELGMKSGWWNNRIQVNLSYYDMDYSDLQIFELNSRFLLTLLNAQAESKGVEASIDMAPTENLTVSASTTGATRPSTASPTPTASTCPVTTCRSRRTRR